MIWMDRRDPADEMEREFLSAGFLFGEENRCCVIGLRQLILD